MDSHNKPPTLHHQTISNTPGLNTQNQWHSHNPPGWKLPCKLFADQQLIWSHKARLPNVDPFGPHTIAPSLNAGLFELNQNLKILGS